MEIKVMVTGAHTPEGAAVAQGLEEGGVLVFRAFSDGSRRKAGEEAAKHVLRLPPATDPRFDDAVFAACRSFGIEVVIPVGRLDVSALNLARVGNWGETGASLMLAAEGSVDRCLDRVRVSRGLSGVVHTPKTQALDHGFQPDRWELPLVVRPRTGPGAHFVHEPEQLRWMSRTARLVAQEFLPGEELSIDVFAGADGLIQTAMAWRKSNVMVDGGRQWSAVMDPEAVFLAGAAVRQVGLTMAGNVRVRRDAAGRFAVFDINPGFGPTIALTISRGLNLPMMALAQILGRPDVVVAPHTGGWDGLAAIA